MTGPARGARPTHRTLTAVPGLRVGHAAVAGGGSGCTVVLGPFRAAVEAAGMATGSRELGPLDPLHLVPRANALLFTGGSAFGLAAADGVMAWLSERGLGFDTGVARVPIVPAAVLFDLAEGVRRPDAATGRAACEAAHDGPVAEGRVGAGTGATVGKLAGPAGTSPGGLGTWAVDVGPWRVGALAAVNAVGDVLDRDGRIVAGARGTDGAFLDSSRLARSAVDPSAPGAASAFPPAAGTSTTLAVVATDAPLSRTDLGRLARMAATALSRRVRPVHTPFDGDMVFALSTSEGEEPRAALELLALGDAAREALEESLTRGVTQPAPADELR